MTFFSYLEVYLRQRVQTKSNPWSLLSTHLMANMATVEVFPIPGSAKKYRCLSKNVEQRPSKTDSLNIWSNSKSHSHRKVMKIVHHWRSSHYFNIYEDIISIVGRSDNNVCKF